MRPAVALAIFVVLVVVFSVVWATSRSRRGVSLENERSANFRSSQNPNDPHCPRCHGRGVLAYRLTSTRCPLCEGTRHVSYGG